MAKVVVGAEIKVDGLDKANQSVGSFKKQLREAQADLVNMADKFGLASKEAQSAAMKVANLKDAIGDAKALADTFNPDKKFVALGGAVQGVVAGFSAFTGAMGLLGAESKEVEQLLLKVQAAMALQQGISGIAGSVDSFKLLGKAIQSSTAFQKIFTIGTVLATTVQKAFGVAVETTSVGFKVLRTAIISTGIGALVVLLTTVISKIIDWASSNDELEASQNRLKKSIEETSKAIDKNIKVVSRATEEAVALAKSQGKSEAEIYKIRKNGALEDERLQGVKLRSLYNFYETQKELFDKGKIDEETYLSAKTAYTDAYDNYEEFKSKQRIDRYNEEGRIISEAKAAADKEASELNAKRAADAAKAKAENEKRIEEERKAQEYFYNLTREWRKKMEEDDEAYAQKLKADEQAENDAKKQRLIDNETKRLQTVAELAELALVNDPNSIDNKIAKINADLGVELQTLAAGDLRRQILTQQATNNISALKEEAAARDLALAQQSQQQQLAAVGQGLSALSDLAGRETAAGKVLAIAEATINTYKAAAQVFARPAPGAPPISLGVKIASMVAAIATGIGTVKKIVSTKVPKGGSGGGGANLSVPSISAVAPIAPQAQVTNLSQSSINAVGNAAQRNYVLETEVSTNQERIRRLNRAARIN